MRSASVAWLMETTFGCRVATLQGRLQGIPPLGARIVHHSAGSAPRRRSHRQRQNRNPQPVGRPRRALPWTSRASPTTRAAPSANSARPPQPTQAQFENELALVWRATDPDTPGLAGGRKPHDRQAGPARGALGTETGRPFPCDRASRRRARRPPLQGLRRLSCRGTRRECRDHPFAPWRRPRQSRPRGAPQRRFRRGLPHHPVLL